ncbi:sialidase family protein [Posidoniimonas polymericola]|nr:sialidase family protein [Posidoniimonas polymericola]
MRAAGPTLGRAAGWLVLLAAATVGADPQSEGPIVSEGFIYQTAPYPSCHASTLVETGDGLLAAWFGGTHERHTDVEIWTARRVDGAWDQPTMVADGVSADGVRYPTWNPVLFQPEGGPLLLFYKVGPTPQDWWGMLKTSDDNGHSWSDARRLPDGILGPIKNKPAQLVSGSLLLPTSTEDQGWRLHFEFTDPQANEFTRTDPIPAVDGLRAIQPSVLQHRDGRLQAIGRTRRSGVFQTWSSDQGKTWSEVSPLGLPNPSSGTDALTMADGRHVLVYNHSSEGRSPLNVALSDDGVHWQGALVLEDDPTAKAGFAYPAVIQTSDGLVHITYTWKRERIKHVVLDPSRLDAEPMVDNQWPAAVSLLGRG